MNDNTSEIADPGLFWGDAVTFKEDNMPAPRKKNTKSERFLQEWLASIASEANNDRGALVHRLARNLIVNGPLTIPEINEHVTDEDDDSLSLSSSNTATLVAKPLEIKKRVSPAYKLSSSTLTLGADPEFLVVKRNGTLDDCRNMERNISSGNIGYDHSGRCAEFRPNPGMPKDIINNIRDMMVVVRDIKPNHRIVAGGGSEYDMACGGHIHFNIQRLNLTNVQQTKNDGEDQSLIHALDSFLGRKMLKMNGAKRARPNNTQYGFCGDWRGQSHGFEYRTPPSFIGDPVFAESVFAVAYRIAKIWMNDNNAFVNLKGRIAKRREYSVLIPTAAEMPVTTDRDYWRAQISTFIKIAWDSDFKLDNSDMIEKWTAGIPSKLAWRRINFDIETHENNMDMVGSIMVPIDFRPNISFIKVIAVPEWQNVHGSNVLVSKAIYDAFNLRTKRRDIERHGSGWVAVEGNDFVIGIPFSARSNGTEYSMRCLNSFLLGLNFEFDLQTL